MFCTAAINTINCHQLSFLSLPSLYTYTAKVTYYYYLYYTKNWEKMAKELSLVPRSCYTDRTPRHFKTSVYNTYSGFKSVFSRLVFQENSVLVLDILVIYVRTLTHVHALSICSPCHYSLSFLIVSLSQLITREHNLLV